MNKFIQLLKNPPKWLVFVLILVALGMRFEQEYFTQKFHSDQQYIIICNRAYLNGNDFVSTYSDPEDISKSIDRANIDPELFNYVSTFFTFLTQSDFYGIVLTSFLSILLYLLAWVLLFIFLKKYLSTSVIFPFFLILIFSPSPFVFYGGPDLFAKSLLWLAFALSVGIFSHHRKVLFLLLSASVLGFVFWARYAYYPLVPIIPALFFLLYFLSKEKKYLTYSFVYIAIISIIVLISFSVRAEGIDFFLKGAKSAGADLPYQFENLKKFNYLFPIQGYINQNVFFSIFKIIGFENLAEIVKLLFSTIVLSVIVVGVFYLLKASVLKFKENHTLFYSIFSVLSFSLLTIALLIYMSINKLPENSRSGINWTHVQEARYYAPVFASFLFLFLILVYENQNWVHFKVKQIAKFLLYLFVFLSVLYFPISKYKLVQGTPYYFTFSETKYMASQTDDLEMLKKLKHHISESFINGIRPLFISHGFDSNLGELFDAEYGGSVMTKLNDLKTSQEINVIILENLNKKVPEISMLIEAKKLQADWESEKYKLYRFKVVPNN